MYSSDNNAMHNLEAVSSTHQTCKQDASIQFRMRMICKDIDLIPCYKVSKVWMAPITMLQQIYFPRSKLANVEKLVRDCTGTKLKLMEQFEINKMQAWLQRADKNKDKYPPLTPHEYSCCVEDLRENFEYIEHVVLGGTSLPKGFSSREAHSSRTKAKDSSRHSSKSSKYNHKESHSSERSSKGRSPDLENAVKSRHKHNEKSLDKRSDEVCDTTKKLEVSEKLDKVSAEKKSGLKDAVSEKLEKKSSAEKKGDLKNAVAEKPEKKCSAEKKGGLINTVSEKTEKKSSAEKKGDSKNAVSEKLEKKSSAKKKGDLQEAVVKSEVRRKSSPNKIIKSTSNNESKRISKKKSVVQSITIQKQSKRTATNKNSKANGTNVDKSGVTKAGLESIKTQNVNSKHENSSESSSKSESLCKTTVKSPCDECKKNETKRTETNSNSAATKKANCLSEQEQLPNSKVDSSVSVSKSGAADSDESEKTKTMSEERICEQPFSEQSTVADSNHSNSSEQVATSVPLVPGNVAVDYTKSDANTNSEITENTNPTKSNESKFKKCAEPDKSAETDIAESSIPVTGTSSLSLSSENQDKELNNHSSAATTADKEPKNTKSQQSTEPHKFLSTLKPKASMNANSEVNEAAKIAQIHSSSNLTGPKMSNKVKNKTVGTGQNSSVPNIAGQATYSPYQFVPVPVVPMNLASAVSMPSCFFVTVPESTANVPPNTAALKEIPDEKPVKNTKVKNRNGNNNNTASCFNHVLDELQENSKSDQKSNSVSIVKKRTKKEKMLQPPIKKTLKPVRVKSKVLSVRPIKSSTDMLKTRETHIQKRIRSFRTPQRTARQVEYGKRLMEAVHLRIQQGKENKIDKTGKQSASKFEKFSVKCEYDSLDSRRSSSFEKEVAAKYEKDMVDSRRFYDNSISSASYSNKLSGHRVDYRSPDNPVNVHQFTDETADTTPTRYFKKVYSDPYTRPTDSNDHFNHQEVNTQPGENWNHLSFGGDHSIFDDCNKPSLLGPYPNSDLMKQSESWKQENRSQLNAILQKRYQKFSPDVFKSQQNHNWQNRNHVFRNASPANSAQDIQETKHYSLNSHTDSKPFIKPHFMQARNRYNDYYRSKSVQRARSFFYKPNRHHFYAKKYLAETNEEKTSDDVENSSGEETPSSKTSEKSVAQNAAATTLEPKLAGRKELVRRVKPENTEQPAAKKPSTENESALSDLISYIRRNPAGSKDVSEIFVGNDHSNLIDDNLSVKVTAANTLLPDSVSKPESAIIDPEGQSTICLSEFVTLDEDWEDNDTAETSQDKNHELSLEKKNLIKPNDMQKTKTDLNHSNISIAKSATKQRHFVNSDVKPKKVAAADRKSSPKLDVTKLLKKVEQDDVKEVEDSIGMLLKNRKTKKALASVKWPFFKSCNGWNDVFLDFSLNIDLKVGNTSVTKDEAEHATQDRTKNVQPMQWKKKLIEKIDMNALSQSSTKKLLSDSMEDVGALKSEVSSTMTEMLNRIEKNFQSDPTTNKNSNSLPLQNEYEIASEKKQSYSPPVSEAAKESKANPSTNIFDSIATLETSSFDLDQPDQSIDLRKVDFFQVFSRRSRSYFTNDIHYRMHATKSYFNPKAAHQSYKLSDEMSSVAHEKPNSNFFVDTESQSDGRPSLSRSDSCHTSTNYSTATDQNPKNQSDEDDDASTFVPDEEERSSDETVSDSEKIPLRSYAKVPLWNNKELLKAWNVKNCFVNVQKLNVLPDNYQPSEESFVETLFPADSQDFNSNFSTADDNICSIAGGKLAKAKKSIYRPSRSLFQRQEKPNYPQKVFNQLNQPNKVSVGTSQSNKGSNIGTMSNRPVIKRIEDLKGNEAPMSAVDQRNKNHKPDISKSNETHRRTSKFVTRSSSRLLKRRTELPSVSSDEEELSATVEENVTLQPQAAAASSTAGCSDDDILLISCKPYLSKTKDEKKVRILEKSNAATDADEISKQVIHQPRRNKARKTAVRGGANKDINPVYRRQQLFSQQNSSDSTGTNVRETETPVQNQDKIIPSKLFSKNDERISSYSFETASETNLNTIESSSSATVFPTAREPLGSNQKESQKEHENAKKQDANYSSQPDVKFVDLPGIQHKKLNEFCHTNTAFPTEPVVEPTILSSEEDSKNTSKNPTSKESLVPSNHSNPDSSADIVFTSTVSVATKSSLAASQPDGFQTKRPCTDQMQNSINVSTFVASAEKKSTTVLEQKATTAANSCSKSPVPTSNKSIVVAISTNSCSNVATSGVFHFKTVCPPTVTNSSLLRSMLTPVSSQKNEKPIAASSVKLSSAIPPISKTAVLSPPAQSVFGETYHHGMLEINLSAPAACLQLGRQFSGKILPYGVMAFVRRRIPYIQVRLAKTETSKPPPPYGNTSAGGKIIDGKTSNDAKAINVSDSESEAGTLLIRMRDAAFSLKIDTKQLLQQVVEFQIRCYIPNEYTQSVYNMIYNQVALADDKMKGLLGLNQPDTKAALNENSMMHLNDYLKIILPNFYVQKFTIFKDALPNYVSVTTYKPIDVVTAFVIQTFSQSYAYNKTLIEGDIPIKAVNFANSMTKDDVILSSSKKRVVSKRKSSSDSNSSQAKTPKSSRARKTSRQKSSKNESSNIAPISLNSNMNSAEFSHYRLVANRTQNSNFMPVGDPARLFQSPILTFSPSQFSRAETCHVTKTSALTTFSTTQSTLNFSTAASVPNFERVRGQAQPLELINKDMETEVTKARQLLQNKSNLTTSASALHVNNLPLSKAEMQTIGARFVNGDVNIPTPPLDDIDPSRNVQFVKNASLISIVRPIVSNSIPGGSFSKKLHPSNANYSNLQQSAEI